MPVGSANSSINLSSSAGALPVPQPLSAGNTGFCDLTRPLSDFREGFPTTWDPNPAQTFEGWRIGPQIRGLHHAKLQHMGYPAELWLPLTEGLRCSCVKTTFETAIRDCPSCHGVGYVPGFNKFLYETYFFDVAEAENFTFNGTTLSQDTKPHRIVLEKNVNTGSFLTHIKPINNGPIEQDWLLDVQRKLPQGGAVNVEFSTNGVDFYPITYINGEGVKPLGQSMIQLRVTLKRVNSRSRSPEFYIVRLRRLKYEHSNFSLLESRRCVNKSLSPGEILVLWDWQQTTPVLADAQGFVREEVKKIWTAPLDYFDTSIEIDSPEAAIKDLQAGPHPFIRFTTGIEREHIFALTQAAYSEQLHVFSYQSFQARRPQENSEVYNKVRNGCVFPEEITVPARIVRTNLLSLTGGADGILSRQPGVASSDFVLTSVVTGVTVLAGIANDSISLTGDSSANTDVSAAADSLGLLTGVAQGVLGRQPGVASASSTLTTTVAVGQITLPAVATATADLTGDADSILGIQPGVAFATSTLTSVAIGEAALPASADSTADLTGDADGSVTASGTADSTADLTGDSDASVTIFAIADSTVELSASNPDTGVSPTNVTPPEMEATNIYNVGQTIEVTEGTWDGIPDPTI